MPNIDCLLPPAPAAQLSTHATALVTVLEQMTHQQRTLLSHLSEMLLTGNQLFLIFNLGYHMAFCFALHSMFQSLRKEFVCVQLRTLDFNDRHIILI